MSHLTFPLGPSLRAALVTLVALAAPAALRAQTTTTPKVFYACYVPSSGSVYRIKEANLKQQCSKSTHVQFSWTDGAGHLSQVVTVTSGDQEVSPNSSENFFQACPSGTQAVGGGYFVIAFDASDPPSVVESAPDDALSGWTVRIANQSASSVILRVKASCAK